MGEEAAPRTMLQRLANPTLQSLFHDTATVSAQFQALVQGLDEARLRWAPRPGAWSIAQCLEHLTITEHEAQRSMCAALRRARRSRRSDRPMRPNLVGRWLISQAGPQGGRRRVAPARLTPPGLPEAGALARFLTSQERLLDVIQAADGFDINRIVLVAPISRVLPISLGEVLAVAIAHSRRHLEQARRVRNEPGFPTAAESLP